MPKVRTVALEYKGTKIEAEMWVDRKGSFTIKRTTPYADMKETSGHPTAMAAWEEWQKGVKELADKQTTSAKVLLVRFMSNLVKRRHSAFCDRATNVTLQALVAEEKTTTIGEATTKRYRHHPDVNGMHKEDPIPCQFRLDRHENWNDIWDGENTLVIPWTAQAEQAIVNACNALLALTAMLDQALETPEGFTAAIEANRFLALPSTRPGPGERIAD